MTDDTSTYPSLTAMFLTQVDRLGDQPFLWAKREGAWTALNWNQTRAQVMDLASGLVALGLNTGDRVMLVSENRPEWVIADLAIMAAGGITVPAYTTNTAADHAHVLTNSGARFVVTSSRGLTEKVMAAALQVSDPPTLIAIQPPTLKQASGLELMSWADTLALGRKREFTPFPAHRDTTACIIYTSGTGGAPRGVMLSHGALLADAAGAGSVLTPITEPGEREVFLSFLPLSHAYEHLAGMVFPLMLGAHIYFAESIDALAGNMTEIHPTIMTAVPRLYETMRGRILNALPRQSRLKRFLFLKTVELGSKRYVRGALGPLDALLDAILTHLVRTKVRARFGGRLKALVSGGAPLSFDVGLFFIALGVRILQGYGQTEAAPVISVNLPGRIKLDSVGPALECCEVRIADDGEILVRGENVMQGYWNDPQGTAQVIRDGWLHTGDIGEMDADGFIRITDRKKDIIVNSGGDNISPQRIEGLLTLQPEIAQAMVHGDRRPHVVALLVPDAEWAADWARRHGKPHTLAELQDDPAFRRALGDAVDRVNRTLSNIEKVRRYLLTVEGFTTENGMLTPTLKIRRHIIRKIYGDRLEGLYGQN